MKPNILLLTTGCGNSTIVMRQLAALGWNLGDVDKYAENVRVRAINYAILKGKAFDRKAAAGILGGLPQPWAIKHPEFAHTLPHWHELFAAYCPAMLWITKDIAYVRQSFHRRFNMDPSLADRRHELCAGHYEAWPYAKFRFDVSQLDAAFAMYDATRSFTGGQHHADSD